MALFGLQRKVHHGTTSNSMDQLAVFDSNCGTHSAAFQTSNSLRSKFHSFLPDTTFLNPAGPRRLYSWSKGISQASSSEVISSTTASLPKEATLPPTKTTPSYMESASASPVSPQMTILPFCIMKPAI